ncbi:hypothetical protein Bbelb_442060 [Branchiostoma belcheri]|nr:hypothetical protein Bbelb_442060 [Branchiostoma belcheri]
MTAHRKIKDTAHIVYEYGTDHLRFMLPVKFLAQPFNVNPSIYQRRCGEYHTGAAVITQVPLPLGVFSHRNTSPSVINGDNRNKRRSALANEPGKADESAS